jgi:putative addiction module killer protein
VKWSNFGDCEPVSEGASETRIHTGAGHRVYYLRTGSVVYVLQFGGNKSIQKRDIASIIKLARGFKKDALCQNQN